MHAEAREATAALSASLAMGVVTRLLLGPGAHEATGTHFWIWDALMIGVMVLLFARKKVSVAGWGAVVAALLLGTSVAIRESAWSSVLGVPWTAALWLVIPHLLADADPLADFPRALWARWDLGRAAAETVETPVLAVGRESKTTLLRIAKGLAIGVPLSLVFVGLFLADADFAGGLQALLSGADGAVSFVVGSLVLATVYLFAFRLQRRRRHVEQEPSALLPYRQPPMTEAEEGGWTAVTPTTWATVLMPVSGVFAVFVFFNVRHLFHGDALVRRASGPSYSAYLHSGFYQLLFAAILSVCLVLTGHVLLRARPGRVGEGRVAGGVALRTIEAALVVLTAVVLGSCVERLWIYEEAYGATYLRLGVAVVMVVVFGVLALTLYKTQWRHWRGFGAATAVLLTAIVVCASAFDADGYIAWKNLDRAARGHALDEGYLAGLSSDARVALGHPYWASGEHDDLRRALARAWSAKK